MKALFSFLSLLLFFSASWAQETSYADLQFHSEMEAIFFQTDFLEKNRTLSDQVGLLMATDTVLTANKITAATTAIKQVSSKLRTAKIQNKTPFKAATLLHETLHEVLLREFDIDAQFKDVFENGRYNCVTASALYALVLEELNLAYEIHELPSHVYLVYAPGTADLLIETTKPVDGIYLSDAVSYTHFLTDLDLFTPADLDGKNMDQIYEEFLADVEIKIDFRGLTSHLYYNAALSFVEELEFERAVNLIKKSVYLDRNIRKIETWSAILKMQLVSLDYNQIDTYEPLFALQYFPVDAAKVLEGIQIEFCSASENLLVLEKRLDDYNALRTFFLDKLHPKAENTRKYLQFIHHVQMGRYHALLKQNIRAYQQFGSAYQIDPTDTQVHSALISLISEEISVRYSQGLDAVFSYVEEQHQKYPFLDQNEYFHSLIEYSNFALAIEAFDADEEQNGLDVLEQCRPKLEALNDGSELFNIMTGLLFGSASSYYFRKGNKEKAVKFLAEGLAIAPQSEELMRKMKLLEDYYNN